MTQLNISQNWWKYLVIAENGLKSLDIERGIEEFPFGDGTTGSPSFIFNEPAHSLI